MTVAGKSGNVSVSIWALFADENMTVNLSAASSDDVGSVGEVSVSIGMLYIDGEMTINFSGLSAGSVVIDRVVMPADSLLTFRRSGGEKIHDPRALHHAVFGDHRPGSCRDHKRRNGLRTHC